jgi:hypothetical protein
MTALAPERSGTRSRRRYQRHVAALLDEIERRRSQLLLLAAGGATFEGLAGLKAELHAVRDELALTVANGR